MADDGGWALQAPSHSSRWERLKRTLRLPRAANERDVVPADPDVGRDAGFGPAAVATALAQQIGPRQLIPREANNDYFADRSWYWRSSARSETGAEWLRPNAADGLGLHGSGLGGLPGLNGGGGEASAEYTWWKLGRRKLLLRRREAGSSVDSLMGADRMSGLAMLRENAAGRSGSFVARVGEPQLDMHYKPLDYVEELAEIQQSLEDSTLSKEERARLYLEQGLIFRGLGEIKHFQRSLKNARKHGDSLHWQMVLSAWLRYEMRFESVEGEDGESEDEVVDEKRSGPMMEGWAMVDDDMDDDVEEDAGTEREDVACADCGDASSTRLKQTWTGLVCPKRGHRHVSSESIASTSSQACTSCHHRNGTSESVASQVCSQLDGSEAELARLGADMQDEIGSGTSCGEEGRIGDITWAEEQTGIHPEGELCEKDKDKPEDGKGKESAHEGRSEKVGWGKRALRICGKSVEEILLEERFGEGSSVGCSDSEDGNEFYRDAFELNVLSGKVTGVNDQAACPNEGVNEALVLERGRSWASHHHQFAAGDRDEEEVVFLVDNVHVPCNRSKMASLSAPFQALLSGDFIESRSRVVAFDGNGISAAGLRAIDFYSRTGKLCNRSTPILLEVLGFASRYCCEELKKTCDMQLARRAARVQVEEAANLIDYGLEENAPFLVAACLRNFLFALPSSLKHSKVLKLMTSAVDREKLHSVGQCSFPFYFVQAQALLEEHGQDAPGLTFLLERAVEEASSWRLKAVALHQLGCLQLRGHNYTAALTSFQEATLTGHTYSIAGVARSLRRLGHRRLALAEMNDLLGMAPPPNTPGATPSRPMRTPTTAPPSSSAMAGFFAQDWEQLLGAVGKQGGDAGEGWREDGDRTCAPAGPSDNLLDEPMGEALGIDTGQVERAVAEGEVGRKKTGWMYQERALQSDSASRMMNLKLATEHDPTLTWPYKMRSAIYMDDGKHDEALCEINRILNFKVTADALEWRAHLHICLRQYENAVRDFRALMSIDPNHLACEGHTCSVKLLRLLSRTSPDWLVADCWMQASGDSLCWCLDPRLKSSRRSDGGQELLSLLVAMVPQWSMADCWIHLYDSWSMVDDVGCLAVVHMMLENEPSKGLLFFRQSLLLLRLNCTKAAMRSLRLARQFAATEAERLIYEGWMLYDSGRRDAALKRAEQSIALSRSFEACFLLAYALADKELDDSSKAVVIELLEWAIKCPSDGLRKGQALNNLGSVYVDSRKYARAEECYMSALQIRHTRAHQGLARVYASQYDKKKAHDEMSKLIEKARNSASAYEKRSEYCERDLAVEDLAMATRLDPLRTYPYRYRAALLMDSRNDREAIAELSKAIAFKADIQLLHLRAEFYETRLDYRSALCDVRAVLSMDPSYTKSVSLYEHLISLQAEP